LLITPKSEVLMLPHDSAEPAQIELDPRWRRVAFVRASESFPQLAALRPRRPVNGIDCPRCGAEGVLVVGSVRMTCGECSGLGWCGPDV
jgi:hypothetical protein